MEIASAARAIHWPLQQQQWPDSAVLVVGLVVGVDL